MVAVTSRLTIEEFEQLPPSEHCWELINGVLVEMNAASTNHGAVAGRISGFLFAHVNAQRLGEVFVAEAGFVISHERATVRVPDVAFVRTERLAALGDPHRFGQSVPDLVVEVVSPNDSWREVWSKATMWLGAGVRLVWLADPESREVIALTPDAPQRTFTVTDDLVGEPVLPEFTVPLADIFRAQTGTTDSSRGTNE